MKVGEPFKDDSPETNQEAIDLVYGVVQAWYAAHRKLSNFPKSKKLFEDYLKSNFKLYF
tara:strand:+ start:151 stop:327 length:177 start_codon:yes stop_codon:yes gene_type:complete